MIDMRRTLATARTTWILGALLLVSLALPLAQTTEASSEDLSLTAENIVGGRVRLSWTYLEDERVDRYDIFWETKDFDSVEGMEARSSVLGNTLLVPDLEDGVRYHFAVAAVDVNGTVLVEDHDEATPKIPALKEVNYPNLMVALIVTTLFFLFALVKIPKWTKRHKGGA
jgi:hypothetical protein